MHCASESKGFRPLSATVRIQLSCTHVTRLPRARGLNARLHRSRATATKGADLPIAAPRRPGRGFARPREKGQYNHPRARTVLKCSAPLFASLDFMQAQALECRRQRSAPASSPFRQHTSTCDVHCSLTHRPCASKVIGRFTQPQVSPRANQPSLSSNIRNGVTMESQPESESAPPPVWCVEVAEAIAHSRSMPGTPPRPRPNMRCLH